MKYPDNIREVAELSPDFMGFIYYPQSKRFVGNNFVIPDIPSSIKKVGVFVNETRKRILNMIKQHKLDYVQLHGDETAEFCTSLYESAKIIKAFGIDNRFDFSLLNDYENYCEYFLFDTKTKEYGGSGKTFDKTLLKKNTSSKPFFISGGIGMEEATGLMHQMPGYFAIDVNSKFETEPGFKDIHKLKILNDELQR